jgi:hypothetical protein
MRTKTLLLTAALSAAGIATSMAQVYSVNAVGYVNTTLVPGFNLVSNPLRSTEPNGNQIQNLFGSLPANTIVYLWNGAGFDQTINDPDFGWSPENVAQRTLLPGSGAFVRLPANAGNRTLTFVGEVVQGQNLSVPIAQGFNLVSSIVPQEGTATTLGYQPQANDVLYFWNETANQNGPGPAQSYVQTVYDAEFGEFSIPLPTLAVGDAFFIRSQTGNRTWTRNFNVNQ